MRGFLSTNNVREFAGKMTALGMISFLSSPVKGTFTGEKMLSEGGLF
jgi:hypothetical protein